MIKRIDAAAVSLNNEFQGSVSPRIIKLSEEDFAQPISLDARYAESEEEFYRRATAKGKLDAGRTVRSGLAYDFDSTDPVSPRDAARAAGIKAELGDEPLHGIEKRYAYRFIKRAFDIAFSAAVIIFFSWLYLIIAIAVKVDDPKGPVLFKQERVGWSIIGQKSGAALGMASRPALSALIAQSARHPRLEMGVAA